MKVTYLSRVPLNPLRRDTQKLLTNPQALHAAVLGGLPPAVQGRTLWRDEVRVLPSGATAVHVLALTPALPDWSALIEQAGWSGSEEGRGLVRSLDPLLELVVMGREFGFKVRGNPVSSTKAPSNPTASQRRALEQPGRRRGIRVAERTVEQQLRWFVQRSQPGNGTWGFALVDPEEPTVSVVAREHRSFLKGREERHRVTLDRVTYEGRLRVTDPERLRAVLITGLGGAKAYGCGLLTLAPIAGSH